MHVLVFSAPRVRSAAAPTAVWGLDAANLYHPLPRAPGQSQIPAEDRGLGFRARVV